MAERHFVAALVPGVGHLVARVGQCLLHLLVGRPPVAVGEPQVVGAVLQENPDRLGLELANQGRIDVAAAMRAETAHVAEDASEGGRTFPGRRERADPAAARAGNGPVVTVGRQVQLVRLGDIGQQLIGQEPHVIVRHGVVLETPIAAARRVAWGHEHAHRDGHGLFVNKLVENRRRVEAHAVLIHMHASRLGRIVLLGDVKRVVPLRPWKDLALVERVGRKSALGHGVRGILRRQGVTRQENGCRRQHAK